MPAGHRQPHRCRRADPRRWMGLAQPAARAHDRQPRVRARSCSPTAAVYGRAPTSIPTCSGRCAAAAATSAWSPSSSSGCTRSGRSCSSRCCPSSRTGRRDALRAARDVAAGLGRDGHARRSSAPARTAGPFVPVGVPLRAGGRDDPRRFRRPGGARGRRCSGSRALLQPLFDVVTPMPYVALQQMLDDGEPPGARARLHEGPLPRRAADAAIDALAERLPARRSRAHRRF